MKRSLSSLDSFCWNDDLAEADLTLERPSIRPCAAQPHNSHAAEDVAPRQLHLDDGWPTCDSWEHQLPSDAAFSFLSPPGDFGLRGPAPWPLEGPVSLHPSPSFLSAQTSFPSLHDFRQGPSGTPWPALPSPCPSSSGHLDSPAGAIFASPEPLQISPRLPDPAEAQPPQPSVPPVDLRTARMRANMTDRKVATVLGLPVAQVLDVESGMRALSQPEVHALRQVGVCARPGWSMRPLQLRDGMLACEADGVIKGLGFTRLSLAEAAEVSSVDLVAFAQGRGRLKPLALASVNRQLEMRWEKRHAARRHDPRSISLGKELQSQRRRAGLSCLEVADAAGLPPGQVRLCELGLASEAATRLIALALGRVTKVA